MSKVYINGRLMTSKLTRYPSRWERLRRRVWGWFR